MQLTKGKKIYFASDFHLGLPMDSIDRSREKKICKFLKSCIEDAEHIFLLGDIFDAWFEYKKVVPRGFTRFLGTLSEIADSGIGLTIFTGNHDLWVNDYYQKEIGAKVCFSEKVIKINDKIFLIGHGDGLGPGDNGYKKMKRIISHPLAQKLYKCLHPDIGMSIAQYFSNKGTKHITSIAPYKGDDYEFLVQYCKQKLQQNHYDYFVFGHRHLALEIPIGTNSKYINLGDWINFDSFAVFDGEQLTLKIQK